MHFLWKKPIGWYSKMVIHVYGYIFKTTPSIDLKFRHDVIREPDPIGGGTRYGAKKLINAYALYQERRRGAVF